MRLFDILGPVMVGPSSSHTAGAVRIGYIAGKLLAEPPVSAEVLLHGSFAATGSGHGTVRAILAGLLGMRPDDPDIPRSAELAKARGLRFTASRLRAERWWRPSMTAASITGSSRTWSGSPMTGS